MRYSKKVLISVIIFTIISIGFNYKIYSAVNKETENINISTMSVYKDMDYTFLKTYNFGGTNSDKAVLTFSTAIELMESEDIRLKKNKYISTKGYYEEGDLGGATYLVSDKEESSAALLLKNGLYANILPDSYISNDGTRWVVTSIKQFGAKGDGKNEEQNSINEALNFTNRYANSDEYDRGIIYIPKGEYKATNQIQANVQNINIVGDGNQSVIFTDNDYRKDYGYDEPFFASWYGKNNFFGFFKLDAREVNLTKYMRQMCLYYCENIYIYDITYYIPQEAWTGTYYEDKQYTNLTIYAGDKVITVDSCYMYQMSGTYRGANIGIMDFWQTGTEDITIMNCELHDNARDEQIGIFSITDKPASYIKNVDFINNTIYTYSTPYREIHGWRTMCFTVAYGSNNVQDINISDNHFISEVDSKFMTFGSVKDCKIRNNIFEIKSSCGNMGYVFDSSCTNDEDVIIDNNEIHVTYKNSPNEGKCLSAGHLTFTNNKVVTDATMTKISDRLGTYENNKFTFLTPLGSCGSAVKFNNNNVIAYSGHSNIYTEVMFMLNEGNESTNVEYIGNDVTDYTYYYGAKNQKVYDKLAAINGGLTINSLNFSNNIYNCPNYRYLNASDYMLITWNRGSTIKNFTCQNNDFQGAKGIWGIDGDYDALNTTREFTSAPNTPQISSIDITNNGEKVTEITTEQDNITLDTIIKIAKETDKEGNVITEEVNNQDVDWVTSIESIATVANNGVVTRNNYGSVYIYVTSKDGSEVNAKVKINFVKSKAEDIELEKEEITLNPNQRYDVMYKVIPYETTKQELKWQTADKNIATVSEDGIITAISLGNTTINCTTTDGTNISKEIKVKIVPQLVTKITLSDNYDYYENIGETKQLTVTSYTPESAINKTVGRWVSSNEKIAKVDSNGRVSIVGRGVCTIYAYSTDESCCASYNIYVKPDKIKNITVSTTKTQAIIKWDKMDNVYGYNLYRYSESEKTWTKIASQILVDNTTYYDNNLNADTEYKYYVVGYISAWDTGTRVEYEGLPSDICTARTNASEVITSISANTQNLSMVVGYPGTISASCSPRNAEFTELNWEIADTNIAELTEQFNKTEARFKGLKEGFTTLTISSKDYYGASTTIPIGVMPKYQVKNIELSSNYCDVEVKWKKIDEEDKIDGYIVSRSLTVEFTPIAYISLDELAKSRYSDGEECYTYLDTGLSFGKTYRYALTPYIIHDGLIYPCLKSEDKNNRIEIQEYIAVDSIIAEDEYMINLGEEKEITAKSATENVSKEEFVWYSKNNNIVTVSKISEKSAVIKGIETGITRIEIIADDEDCNYISPKVIVLPQAVASFKAIPGMGKITLSWEKMQNVTGYNIYRYNVSLGQWELIANTPNCMYEDSNLELNTKYSYKISSYISDAEKSYEGVISEELNVKTLSETKPKLISIGKIATVKEVKNGTELSIEALGLPQIVDIETENPNIRSAKVVWNLETLADGSFYDKEIPEEQIFYISGRVIIPNEIDLNNIGTEVKIKIIAMKADTDSINSDEILEDNITKDDDIKPEDNIINTDSNNSNDTSNDNIANSNDNKWNDSANSTSNNDDKDFELNNNSGNIDTNVKTNSNQDKALGVLPKTGESPVIYLLFAMAIGTVILMGITLLKHKND